MIWLHSMVKSKVFIENLDNGQFLHFQFLFSLLLDCLASFFRKWQHWQSWNMSNDAVDDHCGKRCRMTALCRNFPFFFFCFWVENMLEISPTFEWWRAGKRKENKLNFLVLLSCVYWKKNVFSFFQEDCCGSWTSQS